MALRDPDEIHAVDVHYDGDPWSARGLYPGRPDGAAGSAGDPTRSLWAPGDVIPYRQFADVMLVGHAHVSSGRKLAKIAVLNEQTPIDKTIQVESRWSRGSVALVYEHALGGPGWPDNPVGTGLDAGSPKPTLTSLDDPRRPAGFGPIAPTWRARARCLGGARSRGAGAARRRAPRPLRLAILSSRAAGSAHRLPPRRRVDPPRRPARRARRPAPAPARPHRRGARLRPPGGPVAHRLSRRQPAPRHRSRTVLAHLSGPFRRTG